MAAMKKLKPAKHRHPKFRIVRERGQFKVHVIGANGRLVLWSEKYPTKRTAQKAVGVAVEAARALVHGLTEVEMG